MSFKIFDFAEFRFSKIYLKSLPKWHLNFIVSASLAGNDISVLSKILIGFHSNARDGRPMAEIRAINHWTIRRILGAKIFEFIRLFGRYEKNLRRSKITMEIEYANELKIALDQWTFSKEYGFVKMIRDSATNHYMLDDCIDNIDRFEQKTFFSMLLHQQSGNSYYPIGEEIAHLSFFDADPLKGEDFSSIEDWFNHTAGDLLQLQQRSFKRIINFYPIDEPRKITVLVDDTDVIQRNDRLPILYFDADKARL